MSFDARSLERLQQLGRTLPQALPNPEPRPDSNPDGVAAGSTPARSKRHRVETETDPQALFRALMQVSPDGTVPPHLMDRLRQAEADAASAPSGTPGTAARSGNGTPPRRNGQRTPNGTRRSAASPEELELYSAFQDLLHLEEDDGTPGG
jgi:hypothetical protein